MLYRFYCLVCFVYLTVYDLKMYDYHQNINNNKTNWIVNLGTKIIVIKKKKKIHYECKNTNDLRIIIMIK